ncbi:sec-independent protein translocase protein TatA [Citreimonas salinaria]|uniref:Sec-independent protein translocase protein TatA n=1 Tax=Citreimonas salinaria TaxID=321339 RepID=A0A1H3G9R4_9RHOB|nr:sec-independent protein translocase protein TatA [Citreimonas salinaria]
MLNNIGLPGLLLIAVVVLVLFGRGKISSLMGEVGKGITAFKKGVSEGGKEIEDDRDAESARDVTPESEREPVRTTRDDTAKDAAPEAHKGKV